MTRVLIALQDPQLRLRLTRALEREGYRVRLAMDGLDAVAKVASGRVNLLVLGQDLDGLDFRQTLAWVQKNRPSLPVVVLGEGDRWRPWRGKPADAWPQACPDPGDLAPTLRRILRARRFALPNMGFETCSCNTWPLPWHSLEAYQDATADC